MHMGAGKSGIPEGFGWFCEAIKGAGTVFLNRCDYLDPALAWTGVKHSGRGCTLSRVGFEQLTRPKSYHFRITT